MSSHKARWAAAILLGGLLAPAARAQIAGVIRDPGGLPILDAVVEVWDAQTRLALAHTDSAGRFNFSAVVTTGAVSILARRIGYAAISASLRHGEAAVQYEMHPVANALPQVIVTAATRACSRHDDPLARALWNRARARYRLLPEGYGMEYDAMADSDDVTTPDAAAPADSAMEEDAMAIGAALRAADTSRIEALGYAWPYYIRTLRHGSERRWRYPALGSYLAEHFASGAFGARHTLTLVDTGGGEFQLAFCAPDHRQPEIAGTIRLRADTSLIDASWLFLTPNPNENAGGVVTFIPYRPAAAQPLLLAARSITWHRRHVRDGYYAQRATAFTRWWTEKTMLPVRLNGAHVDTVPR